MRVCLYFKFRIDRVLS